MTNIPEVLDDGDPRDPDCGSYNQDGGQKPAPPRPLPSHVHSLRWNMLNVIITYR